MEYHVGARYPGFTSSGTVAQAGRRQGGLIRRLLVGLTAISLIGFASVDAVAQGNDKYLKQKTHEFEQCANVCQIDHDDRLFKCMPYRKDKEKAVEADCLEKSIEKHEKCMARCPADPRPGQSLSANQGGRS